MHSSWNADDVELLIELVQSKTCLYDLQSKYYKDKRYSNAAWEIIGSKIGKDGKYLIEKLDNII